MTLIAPVVTQLCLPEITRKLHATPGFRAALSGLECRRGA
jgi:hypothetical protein